MNMTFDSAAKFLEDTAEYFELHALQSKEDRDFQAYSANAQNLREIALLIRATPIQ